MTESDATGESPRFRFKQGPTLWEAIFEAGLKDGRRFRWTPKQGITTEELAVCLPLVVLSLTGNQMELWGRIYDKMPSNCQQHFEVVGDTLQEEE